MPKLSNSTLRVLMLALTAALLAACGGGGEDVSSVSGQPDAVAAVTSSGMAIRLAASVAVPDEASTVASQAPTGYSALTSPDPTAANVETPTASTADDLGPPVRSILVFGQSLDGTDTTPTDPPLAAVQGVKWHPGHYVTLPARQALNTRFVKKVVDEVAKIESVKGLQIRYTWAELEPEEDKYVFERIDRDLATVAASGKRLFILLQTKSFNINTLPAIPAYIKSERFDGGSFEINIASNDPLSNGFLKGENIKLWNENVRDRLMVLISALANRFDQHPNLEGVALTETALGQPRDMVINANLERRFFENLLSVNVEMRRSFVNTVVMQFVNYPKRPLPWYVDQLKSSGVALGGPDTFLNEPGLESGIYKYYPDLSGVVPVGPSVQYKNYVSHRRLGPPNSPTIRELFDFATQRLHANYIFWTRSVGAEDAPYFRVLQFLHDLGADAGPAGGLATACPTSFHACRQ